MHPALSLPEILAYILRSLDAENLARCARVCRQFLEEATPLLWEDVTLADCAQLLPGVLSTEIVTERMGLLDLAIPLQGQRPIEKPRFHVNVIRELQPADWTRFQTHAPLVKRLRLPASLNHADLYPVLKNYRSTAGGPLFRNLRSLQVEEVEPCHKQSEFISLFASPSVREVDIRQSRADLALAETVLPAIPDSFPSLSSLIIHLPSYTIRSSEITLEVVKRYSSLVNLEVRTTPQELAQVVQLASQMQRLTRATFMAIGNTDLNLPDDAFQSLQVLRIEGRGVEGIRRIVSSVTSASLEQLEVTWTPESTPLSEADYLPPLDRFPKLNVVRLSAPASLLLHSCAAPVLNCSGLEEVSIRAKSSDFSPDVLRTMAQSWPHLRRLELAPAGPVLTGTPSLGMLRCFAEFCPKMESLSARVRLDLTDDTQSEIRQAACGVGPALRRINVGRSVIMLPEPEPETNGVVEQCLQDVAASLISSWPNLTTLECDGNGTYAEGWAQVQQALDVFRERSASSHNGTT